MAKRIRLINRALRKCTIATALGAIACTLGFTAPSLTLSAAPNGTRPSQKAAAIANKTKDPYASVPGYVPGGYNPCLNSNPPPQCPPLPHFDKNRNPNWVAPAGNGNFPLPLTRDPNAQPK